MKFPRLQVSCICRLTVRAPVVWLIVHCGSIVLGTEPAVAPSLPSESSNRRSAVNPLVAVLQTPHGAALDSHGDPMPAGMIRRFGTARFKSTGWWRRMAFAGNDEWIWLKSDSRVDVMHRESGRVVPFEKLRLGEGNVGCVAASADGSRVAIGIIQTPPDGSRDAAYRVVIVSARTTAHLRQLTWVAPISDFTCLAFSGDGKRLFSGSERGHLQLWDAETGEKLAEQQVETGSLRDATLSPDGKLAFIAGWNRSSRLWKPDENLVLEQKRDGASTCYAPNGKLIATVEEDGIRLWDPESAMVTAHLKEASTYRSADFGIGFTPDSRLLAVPVQAEHRVELWDVERRELVATMPVDSVRGAIISSDGRWLAASGYDSQIAIFDLQTRERVSHPHGLCEPALAIRFADDRELVTTGTGEVLVWDLTSGHMVRRLEHGKRSRVPGLAISPKADFIVTSALDDTVRVWERSTGEQRLKLTGHSVYGGLRSIQFTADGKRFASWGDDAILRWWEPLQGALVGEHTIHVEGAPEAKDIGIEGRILEGVLAPGASALYVTARNELIEFDPQTGARRRSVPAKTDSHSIAMSPDGRWFAAQEAVWGPTRRTTGTSIILFDRATLKLIHRWRVADEQQLNDLAHLDAEKATHDDELAARGWVRCMAFSPDSMQLALVRNLSQGIVDVIEVETGRVVNRFPIDSPGVCIEFSPDGRQLAIGHRDTTVSLWSLGEVSRD